MSDLEADELVDVDDDDEVGGDFDDQVANAYGKHKISHKQRQFGAAGTTGNVEGGGTWARPKSASRLRPRPNSASPKNTTQIPKGALSNEGVQAEENNQDSKAMASKMGEHSSSGKRGMVGARPVSAGAAALSKNSAHMAPGRVRRRTVKTAASLRPQSAFVGSSNLKNGGNAMSAQFLKKRNARKRAEDLQFERMCRLEEQRLEATCLEKIVEANDMARILKVKKTYTAVHCQTSDGHRDFKVQIKDSTGNSANTLTVTSHFFLRDFQKLKLQYANYDEKRVHGTTGTVTGGSGGKSSLLQDENKGGNQSRTSNQPSSQPPMYNTMNSAHNTMASLRTKPSRKETQEELRAVLSDTVRLTGILQEQLDELKRRGWNKVNV